MPNNRVSTKNDEEFESLRALIPFTKFCPKCSAVMDKVIVERIGCMKAHEYFCSKGCTCDDRPIL